MQSVERRSEVVGVHLRTFLPLAHPRNRSNYSVFSPEAVIRGAPHEGDKKSTQDWIRGHLRMSSIFAVAYFAFPSSQSWSVSHSSFQRSCSKESRIAYQRGYSKYSISQKHWCGFDQVSCASSNWQWQTMSRLWLSWTVLNAKNSAGYCVLSIIWAVSLDFGIYISFKAY